MGAAGEISEITGRDARLDNAAEAPIMLVEAPRDGQDPIAAEGIADQRSSEPLAAGCGSVVLKQRKGTDIHAAPVPRQRAAQKGAIRAKDGQCLDALKRLNPLNQKDVQTRDGVRQGASRLDPVNHI